MSSNQMRLCVPLRLTLPRLLCCAALVCAAAGRARAQSIRTEAQARAVAAQFAPVFYQALGDKPRSDLITNFDFDGDWRGDNNWMHAEDSRFPLKAYVYYAVSETATHYFIHYAVFHPQDYKGGSNGRVLSDIIGAGVRRGGKYDPTGLSAEATLAHENDLEGCLVVVAKQAAAAGPAAHVVYVETLAHNHFLKYTPTGVPAADRSNSSAGVSLTAQHPRLYIEPKGHGIMAYQETDNRQRAPADLLRYSYDARADAPAPAAGTASYNLLPLATTLWARARRGVSETYGKATNYGRVGVNVALTGGRTRAQQFAVGRLGSAFRGTVGGQDMARPPWGWYDLDERAAPPGAWFFDPAGTISRHFNLPPAFARAYARQTFLGIGSAK